MQINSKYSILGLGSGLDINGIVNSLAQLESKPIARMQSQRSQVASRMSLMAQMKSALTGLKSVTSKLASGGQVSKVSLTNSNSTIATLTGANLAGTYTVGVKQLASGMTISSKTFTSKSTDLNLSGAFYVNGKEVTVDGGDTLDKIATKINDADAGVKARVVGTAGSYSLQMTTAQTGAAATINFSGDRAHVARSLGFVTGGDEIYEQKPISSTQNGDDIKMRDLFGKDVTVSVSVAGTRIGNFSDSDTYQELAQRMVAGTVANTPVTVTTSTGLTVTSTGGDWKEALGRLTSAATGKTQSVQYNSYNDINLVTTTMATSDTIAGYTSLSIANIVTQGQDAQYTWNGETRTSATNTVTNLPSGGTLTLNSSGESTVKVAIDSSSAQGNLSDLVSSFNAVLSLASSNSKFNSETYETGQFFGDSRIQDTMNSLRRTLEGPAGGTSASEMGISFQSDGTIKLDSAKLEAALKADPSKVEKLFSDAQTGIASVLNSKLTSLTAYGTGMMDTMTKSMETELDHLDKDISAAQTRVSQHKEMLMSRYAAMDKFVSRASSQQSQLESWTSSLSTKSSSSSSSIFDNLLG